MSRVERYSSQSANCQDFIEVWPTLLGNYTKILSFNYPREFKLEHGGLCKQNSESEGLDLDKDCGLHLQCHPCPAHLPVLGPEKIKNYRVDLHLRMCDRKLC